MAALTAAILAATAAKTYLDVSGASKAAKGAKKAGELQGQLLDKQAADATQRGEEAVQQTASQARILTGAQQVALGASGVESTSGSAVDLKLNDQKLAELEEQRQRLSAAREAFGFATEAKLARMGAANAAQSYQNQAYSSALGGALDLYGKYRSFNLNRTPGQNPTTPRASSTLGGYGSGTASR